MKEKNMKKVKEFNFKTAKPVGDKFKGAKISKTFRIDLDVFSWFQEEAERTGIPYQTLLNAKLREAMNLPNQIREMVREIAKEMIREVVREEAEKKAS